MKPNARSGWTIIELFAVMFVIYVPIVIGQFVAKRFGNETGIVVGIFSVPICVTAVFLFYWSVGRQSQQRQRQLSEKYPSIYRIIALPTDAKNILIPEGAEIKVGDYGWEAEPIHKNDLNSSDLIYLHGLTDKWRVVWYAGFRANQIERVGPKPRSQYYLPYSMMRAASSPACPFPVQMRWTTDMGYLGPAQSSVAFRAKILRQNLQTKRKYLARNKKRLAVSREAVFADGHHEFLQAPTLASSSLFSTFTILNCSACLQLTDMLNRNSILVFVFFSLPRTSSIASTGGTPVSARRRMTTRLYSSG